MEGAVDGGALKAQLACLQDQARQLSSLVGDDPQSPLLPLQRELEVAIDGIHERLSSLPEEGRGGRAADAATTASPSSPPQDDEHEGFANPESWGHDDDGCGAGDGGGGGGPDVNSTADKNPPDRSSAAESRRFAAGDPCLAPRVFDRRRARAVVEEVLPGSGGVCLVTWLHPRQRGELVCRYWKEGRSCKFSGPDCPFSHGVEVSMSDLLPDDDNRDWEACSPAATPASAAAAAADDDDDSDDGVAAAAWLPKDQQAGTDGGNDGKAKAATDASHGSGTAGSGTTGSGSGTAKKTTGGAWLADLRSGSRVLARFHDRVWYEATAEGPVTAGKQISVRFRGFEDDGALYVPANSSHLAPLEVVNGSRRGRRRGRGEGGPGASSDSGGGEEGEGKESDLEDAWADAAAGSGDGDTFSAERFFQERVLGDRREVAGGSGGGGSGGGGGSSGTAGGGGDGREGGLCSDAYVFGGWEQHTKGFGSRMMNRMGYRRGEGLGKEKQGISRPVPIRVLPERRALDHLRVDDEGAAQRAGSSAGGDGKTRKESKSGASSNHRQRGGGGGGGMFNFLNNTMHASMNKGKAVAAASASARAGRSSGRLLLAERRAGPSVFGAAAAPFSSSATTGATEPGRGKPAAALFAEKNKRGEVRGGRAAASAASGLSQLELRSHLVGAREAEATLAAKIGRLQETITRNSERDPRTAAQARQKLEEVRLQAQGVRASRDRAERELVNRGSDSGGGGSGGGRKGGKKGHAKGGLFSF